MNDGRSSISTTPAERRTIQWQLAILVVLSIAAFWPEIDWVWTNASRDSNWSYALATPLVVAFLTYRRRAELAAAAGKGSILGLVLLVGSVVVLGMATWPFDYGYPRRAGLTVALAGAVLSVAGWRVLKLSVPMLILVFLSIPVGPSFYATLTIQPETQTLAVGRTLMNMLPGVEVITEGQDFLYLRGNQSGTIALGESHRGATFLPAYLAIGVFITFCRVRPWWQIVVSMVAAVPLVLVCNLVRLLTWGVVTIYFGAGPTAVAPRVAAALVSMGLAYGCFGLLCLFLGLLVVPEDDDEEEPELEREVSGEVTHA